MEGRVHFTKFLDDAGAFIFGKEACYAICDDAGSGDEGIFGFIIGRFEAEEGLTDRGVAQFVPGFFPGGVFVQGYICASAGGDVRLKIEERVWVVVGLTSGLQRFSPHSCQVHLVTLVALSTPAFYAALLFPPSRHTLSCCHHLSHL